MYVSRANVNRPSYGRSVAGRCDRRRAAADARRRSVPGRSSRKKEGRQSKGADDRETHPLNLPPSLPLSSEEFAKVGKASPLRLRVLCGEFAAVIVEPALSLFRSRRRDPSRTAPRNSDRSPTGETNRDNADHPGCRTARRIDAHGTLPVRRDRRRSGTTHRRSDSRRRPSRRRYCRRRRAAPGPHRAWRVSARRQRRSADA